MNLISGLAVGEHFGFPYCHGGDIPDPEFAAPIKNVANLLRRSGNLKLIWRHWDCVFTGAANFQQEFKNQLFVAEHGSWNRSEPQGYRVVLVKFNQGKPVAEQVFIDGWLTKDGNVLGRPVDILEMPDGSLLISDDKLGVIYKVDV